MANTQLSFSSGLVVTSQVSTTGFWAVCEVPPTMGKVYITVKTSTGLFTRLYFNDAHGNPQPYALDNQQPAVFVPGAFAVGDIRFDATGVRGTPVATVNHITA